MTMPTMKKYKVSISGIGETETQGTQPIVATTRAMAKLLSKSTLNSKTLSIMIENLGNAKRPKRAKPEPRELRVGDIVRHDSGLIGRITALGEGDEAVDRQHQITFFDLEHKHGDVCTTADGRYLGKISRIELDGRFQLQRGETRVANDGSEIVNVTLEERRERVKKALANVTDHAVLAADYQFRIANGLDPVTGEPI